MCTKTWRKGVQRMEPRSFQWYSLPGQEAMETKWRTGCSLWTLGSTFLQCRWQSIGTGCGVSSLEIFRNWLNLGLGVPALGVPAQGVLAWAEIKAGGLRGPANFSHPVIMWFLGFPPFTYCSYILNLHGLAPLHVLPAGPLLPFFP